MNLKEYLEKRMLLNQFSDEKVFDIYNKGWESFYIWFDPSADSLQLGNLFAVMAAVNLMKYWNKCYFLVWWATWMIWDPGGKDAERNFLSEETLRHNENAIHNQLKYFLENLKNNFNVDFDFEMVNNYDFYKDMNVLDFLRKVWKYITVNNMIMKDTVRKRIEDPDKSISYTEFSYMLLQWYDFVHLFQEKWVKLQLAWWDQWWNSVTWIELIRKILEKESYVMTIPLVTDQNGKKFWKSAGNAIWLDPKRNSPYFVYQFMINLDDSLVDSFLKRLTLLDFETIEKIVTKHNENPQERYGQKELAKCVVEMIFGKQAMELAIKISEILFCKEDVLELIKSLDQEGIIALQRETWWTTITTPAKLLDIMVESQLVESKWEGKKLIESWALYLNEEKIIDINTEVNDNNFIDWKFAILRKWKKTYKIILK